MCQFLADGIRPQHAFVVRVENQDFVAGRVGQAAPGRGSPQGDDGGASQIKDDP